MRTDLEAIEHLDFDVSLEDAIPCAGYTTKKASGAISARSNCDAAAVLVATYACCGRKVAYCLECYNEICEFFWAVKSEGGLNHSYCRTVVSTGRPFLPDLEWL